VGGALWWCFEKEKGRRRRLVFAPVQDGCRKKEEIKDWQGNVHFPRIVDPRSEIGGKMEDENDISFWNDGRTLFVQECILSTYPKLTRGAKFDKLFRTEQTR